MDTPEADISAIQSGRIQPLPTYTVVDTSSHPLISTVDPLDTRHIPPTYQKEDPSGTDDINSLLGGSDAGRSRESIIPFPSLGISSEDVREDEEARNALERERLNVIESFFDAIKNGQGDIIDLFLTRNLVTANTADVDGKTPLLAAVETKNVKTVQQLLDAGAEPDAFGVVSKVFNSNAYLPPYTITYRTPLQLAATLGHLPLVKLFMERYACNDGLVAPDGQIALRLASSNRHREVVDYLPSRRSGGFLRWKTAHQQSIARAKKALGQIFKFIRFFVWDVEKFFLWTCPKHIIVKPLIKGCKFCWENKKRWFDELIGEIAKIPERIANAGRWVWKGVKKIPNVAKAGAKMAGDAGKACLKGVKAVPAFIMKGVKATGRMAGSAGKACWRGIKQIPSIVQKIVKAAVQLLVDVVKWLWQLITVEIPNLVKKLTLWLWNLLTVRVPKAIGITAVWIWEGLVSMVQALWNVVTKVASLIHTLVTAVVTFFANLSLTDIINGIVAILHAIFVALPQTIWSWVERFGDASFRVMKALFGSLGELAWWIVRGITWLVNYVPRKLWAVVTSMAESVGKGLHEIFVFFRPKA